MRQQQHLVCESPKQVENVNPRFILYPVKKNQKGGVSM